jgi:MFS family permease
MSDLLAMIGKEIAEIQGSQRSLRVFAIAVLLMSVLPSLASRHAVGHASEVSLILGALYVLFAAAIVVANMAPDLVLHERIGRTLDYLLATRMPDGAIFGGKVLVAAAAGYTAALVATALQLLIGAVLSGHGWSWLYLSDPIGRILVFAMPVPLTLYLAVIGTYVALRVSDQRAAYMATMVSLGVIAAPFLLGWLAVGSTPGWFLTAAGGLTLASLVLGAVGIALFRREMLVLSLQD